ncbi:MULTISPECIES: TlpA disulfide reductase family protein [Butyricimonas]|uniref:TlpA disulfide reductase family protein n=1 Tax=Butyricimonas TaxID=574697 RepID=UPI0016526236|nr:MULTISPECIES: TlpA disulfide reductase family protein [Butyricimonas]
MKKILFLFVAFMFMGKGYAQEGFKISGQVANMSDGTVWLLERAANNTLDTLGQGVMKNGRFELSGRVEHGCVALVVMPNGKSAFQIMLENADYEVEVDEHDVLNVKGGVAQSLFNQFAEIDKSVTKERKEVEQAVRAVQSQAQMTSLQNRYESFMKKAMNERIELMRKNNDNFVVACILSGSMQNIPIDIVKNIFGGFTDEVKNSFFGEEVAKYISLLDKIAVGAIAPDFTVLTPEGRPISLHSIQGKVKLVDFWASWCRPCRLENPNMVKLYKEFNKEGLVIFSVSLDTDKAAWEKAIEDDGLVWIHGSELLQTPNVAILYAIKSIPHTILLDENNRIIAKDLRGKELKKKIEELLK